MDANGMDEATEVEDFQQPSNFSGGLISFSPSDLCSVDRRRNNVPVADSPDTSILLQVLASVKQVQSRVEQGNQHLLRVERQVQSIASRVQALEGERNHASNEESKGDKGSGSVRFDGERGGGPSLNGDSGASRAVRHRRSNASVQANLRQDDLASYTSGGAYASGGSGPAVASTSISSYNNATRGPPTAATGSVSGKDSQLLRRLRRGYLLQLEDEDDEKAKPPPKPRSLAARWRAAVYWFCGICDADQKNGIDGSRIVHPASPFYAAATVVTGLLLMYTAIMVPFQLSFWVNDNPCFVNPTLVFDCFTDVYFLLEIGLNFFVGFYDKGRYVDSMSKVARRYVMSPKAFFFDLCTSVPLNLIDYNIWQICLAGGTTDSPGDTKLLRLIKPLRVLKLLRILKTFKFADKSEDLLFIYIGADDLLVAMIKMLKLLFFACFTVHLFACLYWRVKLDYNPWDNIEEFLHQHYVPPGDLWQEYVMCFYFVFTVFCTVGFGDIYPGNAAERIFCLALFLAGVCVFGTIISQTNSIVLDLGRENRELNERMEGYQTLMTNCKVPHLLHSRIREWLRFQFACEREERKKKEALSDENLPEEYRIALAQSLQDDLFSQIPFLSRLSSRMRAGFAAELLFKAETKYFTPGTVVADHKDPADRVFIISSGCVDVFLPNTGGPRIRLRVMRRGDVFGDSNVIGDPRWGGSYGVDADFVARINSSLVSFKSEDIRAIAQQIEFRQIKRRLDAGTKSWYKNQADIRREMNDKIESVRYKRVHELSGRLVFYLVLFSRKLLDRDWQQRGYADGEEGVSWGSDEDTPTPRHSASPAPPKKHSLMDTAGMGLASIAAGVVGAAAAAAAAVSNSSRRGPGQQTPAAAGAAAAAAEPASPSAHGSRAKVAAAAADSDEGPVTPVR